MKENHKPTRFQDRIQRDEEKARDLDRVDARGLSPSKRYKVDPSYSRVPVAICDNTEIGLPCCSHGEGKYCYCKDPCPSQMDPANPTKRIPQAEKVWKEESKKAMRHAKTEAAKTPEQDWDASMAGLWDALLHGCDE